MVKGNWERRAEIAAMRRHQVKAEKEQSKLRGKVCNGEAVFARLSKDAELKAIGSTVLVWLERSEAIDVCRSWFRNETCSNRKCKNIHSADTLLNVRGIIADETDTEHNLVVRGCNPCKVLENVSQKESLRIRYVAVDNSCVFDFEYPSVWDNWIAKRQPIEEQLAARVLHAIDEQSENEDCPSRKPRGRTLTSEPVLTEAQETDSTLCTQLEACDVNSAYNSSCELLSLLIDEETYSSVQSCAAFSYVFSFLSIAELLGFLSSNKAIKRLLLQNNETARRRFKECHSLATQQMNIHRKHEKRAKARQANAKKTGKKDAFARGGNDGGW